ncbi:MAG: RNA pseudouridine synthase [Deltaproteobacteria bacterium]|nr:RNA pseudouridine synthase [Deltaproteobacteria bacterium]
MKAIREENLTKCNFIKTVSSEDPSVACDFFVVHTGLSKRKIKDAMNKGAVWIKKHKGKQKRLRRATAQIIAGDEMALYYDQNILNITPPQANIIHDQKLYSVWFKPSGLLTQGTRYGDHCSLIRQAELGFKQKRKIFVVHRLDREAEGLVILAHSNDAAAKLSHLFRSGRIEKNYRTEVLGDLTRYKKQGSIDFSLGGKASLTEFVVLSYDPQKNTSVVDITLRTGRMHQIRRHFTMLGYPVIGDPRYGRGNKNIEGIKLTATSLKFECPFLKRNVCYTSRENILY